MMIKMNKKPIIIDKIEITISKTQKKIKEIKEKVKKKEKELNRNKNKNNKEEKFERDRYSNNLQSLKKVKNQF
jgi:hypothetical protein